MGCNKSKSQRGGSETYIDGQQWSLEQGQEPNSYCGENFELNQNRIPSVGFLSESDQNYRLSSNQFDANSGQQGYGYSNATGSFDNAVSTYNHFVYDDGNLNGLSASTNHVYNDLPHNQLQYSYNHHQYPYQPQHLSGFNNDFIMGPPSRPIPRLAKNNRLHLSRPLQRCRSFNDVSRRMYQTAHYNTMVRHSSFDNIPSISSLTARNFKHIYCDFNQNYTKPRKSRWRGVKRRSCDEDWSTSGNSTSGDDSKSVNIPIVPHIKRRPSDIGDSYSTANVSNDDSTTEREVTVCIEETKVIDKRVEPLNLFHEQFDVLDLLLFPVEWSSGARERTGFVNISLQSPEGISVQNYFSRSSQSKDFRLRITSIKRIENPFMHTNYLLKKQEMESRNEHVDELYLYHGTKKEYLSGILEDNLNWRLHSEKHRFGQGVSFSPLATYSSHYSDRDSEKVMLLFKVLVGNCIGGSDTMKVPPIINKVVYDVSIKADTTVIVKYSDNEFYPLYKITYLKIMGN